MEGNEENLWQKWIRILLENSSLDNFVNSKTERQRTFRGLFGLDPFELDFLWENLWEEFSAVKLSVKDLLICLHFFRVYDTEVNINFIQE